MSKANQKARLPSVSRGAFNVLEQSIVERRQARELYRSRKKQATRIYREVRSTFEAWVEETEESRESEYDLNRIELEAY